MATVRIRIGIRVCRRVRIRVIHAANGTVVVSGECCVLVDLLGESHGIVQGTGQIEGRIVVALESPLTPVFENRFGCDQRIDARMLAEPQERRWHIGKCLHLSIVQAVPIAAVPRIIGYAALTPKQRRRWWVHAVGSFAPPRRRLRRC